MPKVPSGRMDYALLAPVANVLAGGDIPSALTDLRDIGTYVAKIVNDPRTINKKVLAYTEVRTQNEVFGLVEKLSGEKPERTDVCDLLFPYFHLSIFSYFLKVGLAESFSLAFVRRA